MRTSKPISTISYNSPEFLEAKLNELHRSHTISDWMYIKHKAEADERKDHIHLYVQPNKLIDTMDLQKFFEERDPMHPDHKPLKCIDFRASKCDDWILYVMHLEAYLATKGQSREFHYKKSDFRFCDEDAFEDNFAHALRGSEFAQRQQTLEFLQNGTNPVDLIKSGLVPLSLAGSLNAYDRLLDRHGRHTHTPLVDEDGVIVDDEEAACPSEINIRTADAVPDGFEVDPDIEF